MPTEGTQLQTPREVSEPAVEVLQPMEISNLRSDPKQRKRVVRAAPGLWRQKPRGERD